MKKEFRLTRSTDFERVRRAGMSYAHPLVVLVVLPNLLNRLRIGIAAGRSVGGAVQRNRARRRLRAGILPMLPGLANQWDVVLLARKPIRQASYQQIQDALTNLLTRARLVKNTDVPDDDGE